MKLINFIINTSTLTLITKCKNGMRWRTTNNNNKKIQVANKF